MNPVTSIGAAGLYNASERFARSAERTVSGKGDLAAETVEQVSAQAAFRASISVIKTEDEMMQHLLDIKV